MSEQSTQLSLILKWRLTGELGGFDLDAGGFDHPSSSQQDRASLTGRHSDILPCIAFQRGIGHRAPSSVQREPIV